MEEMCTVVKWHPVSGSNASFQLRLRVKVRMQPRHREEPLQGAPVHNTEEGRWVSRPVGQHAEEVEGQGDGWWCDLLHRVGSHTEKSPRKY
jgi:hypothetical protein